MKESYEKACKEYKNMKKGTFDFKRYTENQGENMEEKEMKKSDICSKIIAIFNVIIKLIKKFFILVFPFILLLSVLTVRFLSELCKWDINISNETIGFAIIVALVCFFLKE